jgi:hypothetical protein
MSFDIEKFIRGECENCKGLAEICRKLVKENAELRGRYVFTTDVREFNLTTDGTELGSM